MIRIKLIKQVWLLNLNSSSFKCFDKRQYFAENVGYEIPLLIPGIFFIAILSALAALISELAALISAVHVQRRGRGEEGGYFLIGQRAHSLTLISLHG